MSLLGNVRLWRPTRLALAATAFSLSCSAVIGITIVLLGDSGETEIRILVTAGTLAGFSILSLPSLFHFERGRYICLAWAGISACLVLFGMFLFEIWGWGGSGDWEMKILASVGVVAFAINHALLMLIVTPSKILISLCQRATIFIIAAVGTMFLIVIWAGDMPEAMMRLFGALGILDALGTVAVPILVRISKSHS